MSKTKEAMLYELFSKVPCLHLDGNGAYTSGTQSEAEYIPAYQNTAVPDDTKLPYLTYALLTGSYNDAPVSLTINIWHRTTSEAELNAYAREFGKLIPRGGKLVQCDGGGLWVFRGSPWCQSLIDDTDRTIKRRCFNVEAEYITRE